ncbi:MAG: SPOR domain-containing protein [Acidobacteriota bacterium]
MSDLADTSYYEIALTNKQVIVAFVILLTLVLAVFLCGVWVGQNGQPRMAAVDPAQPGAAVEPEALANMEEFKFFEEQQQAKQEAELQKPDLGQLAAAPSPQTTLAQDVGSTRQPSPEPRRQTPAAAQAEAQAPPPAEAQAPQRQTPPPPKPEPTPAASAPAPAPAATSPAETFVVQVFSTHDEPQAKKLQQRLASMSYKAFLSTIDVGGQTMYRVRIGPFSQRDQAEKVKLNVRNQLKLDPWVTAASN